MSIKTTPMKGVKTTANLAGDEPARRKPFPSAPEGFTAIVENHQNDLRYFITSLKVLPGNVDDIVQETFILLLKKWHDLEHSRQLGGWLRTTAKNLARNEIRKTCRRPNLLNRYQTTFHVQQDDIQPNELLELSEQHEALHHCLGKLTTRSRRAIEEFYLNGKSAQEVGDLLDMTPAAVRSLLCRAREALATCVSNQTYRAMKPEIPDSLPWTRKQLQEMAS